MCFWHVRTCTHIHTHTHNRLKQSKLPISFQRKDCFIFRPQTCRETTAGYKILPLSIYPHVHLYNFLSARKHLGCHTHPHTLDNTQECIRKDWSHTEPTAAVASNFSQSLQDTIECKAPMTVAYSASENNSIQSVINGKHFNLETLKS